jgi:hypothetical protein
MGNHKENQVMANATATETTEQLIARLQRENASLKANQPKPRKLELKVSEKRAVSLYGIRARFPLTFYKQEWEQVLNMADTIRQFIAAHPELATKGVEEDTPAT